MTQSLYEYVASIYKSLPYEDFPLSKEAIEQIRANPFEQMVNDDGACLKLIRSCLDFQSKVITDSRNRASHILVTWLLGIGLGKHFKLDELGSEFEDGSYQKLWLQSALLHDYGYFLKETSDEGLTIEEISGDYALLTDDYDGVLSCLNGLSGSKKFHSYFTYSYKEIISYYAYAQYLHQKYPESGSNAEKNDHGIVGACVAFNSFCQSAVKAKANAPHYGIIQTQKIACMIAASHNIFKSGDKDADEVYKQYGLADLLSTSAVRITKENQLLLLMSLVDTIECTKRFSQRRNPSAYLQQATTLKYVDITTDDGIELDFSRLSTYIAKERKSEDMGKLLLRHVNALRGISTWTVFSAMDHKEGDSDYIVRISL